jgi:hypothetical protein
LGDYCPEGVRMVESRMLTEDTPLRRSETAVSAEVGGELVALDVTRGVCYGLNSVGTRVWQLLETPRSTSEIVETLIAEYEVSPEVCTEQTSSLLSDLLGAHLVAVAPSSPAGDASLQRGD